MIWQPMDAFPTTAVTEPPLSLVSGDSILALELWARILPLEMLMLWILTTNGFATKLDLSVLLMELQVMDTEGALWDRVTE